MDDILICKHCGKEMNIKQFGRHLLKIHNQKYENYVLNNLEDFKHLNWKLCSKCNNLFRGTSLKCGNCYTKNHQIKKDQYIQCHHCKKSIHSKVISIHLKSHHNIEFLDYVKENLNDFRKMGWCNCDICGNITKKRGNKHLSTCSIECHGKMLSKEYKGRIGHRFTEKEKEKISKTQIKRFVNPENHPFFGKHHSDETKEKISKSHIGLLVGEKNGMFGKTHTPETIEKIFKHRKMNKLENLVADELNKSNISYYFQYFITEDGICKSYDFKIKDKPLILEIDGDFWHGNPNTKSHYKKSKDIKMNDEFKTRLAEKKGIKVIRLWESDIKKDSSIVIRTINSHIYT